MRLLLAPRILENKYKNCEYFWKLTIELNPGKNMLFEKEVTYLRNRETKTGFNIVPVYIQRILDWPQPKTVQELKRLL